ncbi:MAG: prepilin peptidase [Lachnospiraceae bacterium]|nr:prepilin peptidase [Lachnospiraceae bacterium]
MQEELYYLEFIKEVLFFVILLWVSYQDWQQKSISKRSLWLAGILGMGVSLVWKRSLIQMLLSGGIGLFLLILSKCTNGGIGEGDGWFFIVSGWYLDWQDNVQLFLSGLFLCFGVSLILVVQSCFRHQKKNMTLPFLPFLLPAGIELLMDSVRLSQ